MTVHQPHIKLQSAEKSFMEKSTSLVPNVYHKEKQTNRQQNEHRKPFIYYVDIVETVNVWWRDHKRLLSPFCVYFSFFN